MAYPFPESFPASYAEQLNAREGPLICYIYDLIDDRRFTESFSRFFGITTNNIRSADNLAFVSAIVTGSLWGNQYFNTDFKQHKPLFGVNCDILYNEKRHCEKLLTWMFRVFHTTWTQIAELEKGFANIITDISIIKNIVEELRLVHLDETDLAQCVAKLANQLSLAFHVVRENAHVNAPVVLPQPINA